MSWELLNFTQKPPKFRQKTAVIWYAHNTKTGQIIPLYYSKQQADLTPAFRDDWPICTPSNKLDSYRFVIGDVDKRINYQRFLPEAIIAELQSYKPQYGQGYNAELLFIQAAHEGKWLPRALSDTISYDYHLLYGYKAPQTDPFLGYIPRANVVSHEYISIKKQKTAIDQCRAFHGCRKFAKHKGLTITQVAKLYIKKEKQGKEWFWKVPVYEHFAIFTNTLEAMLFQIQGMLRHFNQFEYAAHGTGGAWARQIIARGYATDPKYIQKLYDILNSMPLCFAIFTPKPLEYDNHPYIEPTARQQITNYRKSMLDNVESNHKKIGDVYAAPIVDPIILFSEGTYEDEIIGYNFSQSPYLEYVAEYTKGSNGILNQNNQWDSDFSSSWKDMFISIAWLLGVIHADDLIDSQIIRPQVTPSELLQIGNDQLQINQAMIAMSLIDEIAYFFSNTRYDDKKCKALRHPFELPFINIYQSVLDPVYEFDPCSSFYKRFSGRHCFPCNNLLSIMDFRDKVSKRVGARAYNDELYLAEIVALLRNNIHAMWTWGSPLLRAYTLMNLMALRIGWIAQNSGEYKYYIDHDMGKFFTGQLIRCSEMQITTDNTSTAPPGSGF